MKNALYLTSFLLLFLPPVVGLCQIAGIGEGVEIYKDMEFEVVKNPSFLDGFAGFYKNPAPADGALRNVSNVIFPNKAFKSSYDSLAGMRFRCVSVLKPKNDRTPYFMELWNDKIGTVYYAFAPNWPDGFALSPVGEVKLPADFYCRDIIAKSDKFDGSTAYMTPSGENIVLLKAIKGGKATYYIGLNTIGNRPPRGEGAYILLANGEKIVRLKEKNDVEVDEEARFVHSVFFELTAAEVIKLKKSHITDFKIYVYEQEVSNGKKFQEYLKCMSSLK